MTAQVQQLRRTFFRDYCLSENDGKGTSGMCLSPDGWHLEGNKKTYNINHLEDTGQDKDSNYGKTFYKQKYIEGYDGERDIEFNQTLIVTYTLKYLTDILHETAGFRTDYEITREKAMKGIIRKSKKR